MSRKAVVTGASGTLGSVLCGHLRAAGWHVSTWDRSRVAIDSYAAMEAYLRHEKPDALFHLAIASRGTDRPNEGWLVNYEWPSELAWLTRQLDIQFIFTSTAMVFSNNAEGPLTLASPSDATEGYGYEKRRAEVRVLRQNPRSRIARLGWQIGTAPGSNNMIDFLAARASEGTIRASGHWYPACSFLGDTAHALAWLVDQPPGLYQFDSNAKWTFAQIARALARRHGGSWPVEETADFVYDQRMIDPRPPLPPLEERLPELLDS